MQKHTILLIDDSCMMNRFLSLFLSEKYAVTSCESAEEALEKIENGLSPHLIISDLQLPGIHGVALLHTLRAALPQVPLIVISGMKESKHRIEALCAGADDFLTKPFHPAELDLRIGKLLASGRSRQFMPVQRGISLGQTFRRIAASML